MRALQSAVVRKRRWIIFLLLFAVALTSRLCVARLLANDEPDDARVYRRLALNMLEGRVYSVNEGPPLAPTLIRVPGYPLFLASIYVAFGHGNDSAVRTAQALLDTGSCLIVAALAFLWQPAKTRRWRAALFALILIIACPFVTIYTALILTETLTTFLALGLTLAATLALKARSRRAQLLWWAIAGLCGGLVTLFRPDGGLFAAGVGVALVLVRLRGVRAGVEGPSVGGNLARRLAGAFVYGSVFTAAAALILLPWVVRNERVFHLFQPLAPAYANMPDEFVARGYFRWARTWIDDERYVDPLLWKLNNHTIRIEQVPDKAFDSPDERARVAALLDRYNQVQTQAPGEQSAPALAAGSDDDRDESTAAGDDGEGVDDESSATDDDDDDEQDVDDEGQGIAGQTHVEMTPEIDAEFARLAEERIRRDPLRYYLWLPLRRAGALWFDTHSQFYPFSGELFPLKDLDRDEHQQFWLPLFSALTWSYTLLGVAGAWALWRRRRDGAWRYLALALLLTVPRLAFMSSLENPEPRYVVELFPFLAALGGVALASLRRDGARTKARVQ